MSSDSISINEIIKKSHVYIDQKNFSGASSLLSLVQDRFPEQPDCLHAMGVISLELGQGSPAEELFQRAISGLIQRKLSAPTARVMALFLTNLGRAKVLNGDLAGAMVAWKQSLSINEMTEVKNWYSGLHQQIVKVGKEVERTIADYETGVAISSNRLSLNRTNYTKAKDKVLSPPKKLSTKKRPSKKIVEKIQALVNVGGIENAKAIEPLCFDLLKKFPDCGDVYHWISVSFLYQRKHEDALTWIDKAINLEPWHPYFRNTKGVILKRIGTPEGAAECYREVLKLKPDYAEAHQNLGNIYRDQGKFQEAEGWYRRALELKEIYPECLNNLGTLKKQQKDFDQAIWYFEKAASQKPDYPNPYLNLGILYEDKKERRKAVECYRRALKINPNIHEVWLSLLHSQMNLCDWHDLDRGISIVKNLVEQSYPGELMPFNFLTLPGTTGPEQRKCGELFVKARFEQFIRQAAEMGFSFKKEKKDKIRIGYLSADFRNHAVAWSIVGMLENHDKNSFDVYAFSYSTNDGSEARRRIQACTTFIDIESLDHLSSARMIYDHQIDILIDLTAYTSSGRSEILALRPAPIQVNYLGYPSTMAASFVDYIIGDPIITPLENAEHFSECIALLPRCYFPFDDKRTINGAITRDVEGLPAECFVFCSFNQPYKINPMIWKVWINILKRVPRSVLWLHAFEEESRERLWASFEEEGINRSRLIFAKMKQKLEDHVGRISLADLALDTVPYNGHTTTLETLLSGVPVLTYRGDTFASRVASSILLAANLPELVRNDIADYEEEAVALATDSARISLLRNRVAAVRSDSQLFNSEVFTKNIEKIYFQMHENYISGKSPVPIIIE